MAGGSVWLEFLGIPGSGKSVVAHAAAGFLRDRGEPVYEPTYHINHEMDVRRRQLLKIRYSLALIFCKPGWAFSWLWMILASRQKSLPTFLGMLINCYHILEISRRSGRRRGFHFLDQGVLQVVWSLGQESRRDVFSLTGLTALLRMVLPRRSSLVCITGDAESIVRRLRARKHRQSRMETGKHRPGLGDAVKRAQSQLERLRRHIRDNLPTVIVDEFENGDGANAAGTARTIAERALRDARKRLFD